MCLLLFAGSEDMEEFTILNNNIMMFMFPSCKRNTVHVNVSLANE